MFPSQTWKPCRFEKSENEVGLSNGSKPLKAISIRFCGMLKVRRDRRSIEIAFSGVSRYDHDFNGLN